MNIKLIECKITMHVLPMFEIYWPIHQDVTGGKMLNILGRIKFAKESTCHERIP